MHLIKLLQKLLLTSALSFVIVMSSIGTAFADDTDIYLSTSNITTDTTVPKILIIIDNSGSMEDHGVKVPTQYDPATDYSTGGSWDKTRVYWSTTSDAPTDPTKDYFSRSNLTCQAALDAFNSSSGGHYDNDQIFGWSAANGSSGKWAGINAMYTKNTSWDSVVDCEGDTKGTYQASDGAISGSGANGKYFDSSANKGNNTYLGGGYTTVKSNAADAAWFSGMETLSLWDGNYLNYLETVGTYYYTSRMEAAKRSAKEIVTTANNVNIGIMTYNPNHGGGANGGRVIYRVSTLNGTSRGDMRNVVDQLSGFLNGCNNTKTNFFQTEAAAQAYGSKYHVGDVDPTTSPCSGSMTYTPLAESYYEAYRYFAGLYPDMGGRNALDKQVSYSCSSGTCYYDNKPYSDYCAQNSTSTSCAYYSSSVSRSTVEGYFPTAGSSQPDTTQPKYVSPLANSCEKAYTILITDGDPTSDTSRNTAIDNLVNGNKYTAQGLTGDSSSTSDRLDDLAGYMANNDINTNITGNQTGVLYTVGFDTGISAPGAYLLQMAAGASGGQYLTANDAATLSSKLQAIIYNISAQTTSFAAPSLSVNAFNKLYNRDEIYFSLFKPSLYQAWAGNIKKFKLCTLAQQTASVCDYGEVIDSNNDPAIDITTSRIKDSSVSYWNTVTDGGTVTSGGAGKVMYDDGYANRKLYTYMGSYSGLSSTSEATPTEVKTTNSAFMDLVDPGATTPGDPTLLGMSSSSTTAQVQDMVDWLRGKDSYDEDNDPSTTQRWVFSDPLHSRPLAVTFGALKIGTAYDYNSPVIKLIVAGNDGVIRLIDEDSGKEQWSFIPKEELKASQTLASNNVGNHIYGVDSTVVIYQYDANEDGIMEYTDGDRMYAFIGMRRGRKDNSNNPVYNNIYAFDLSPTSVVTSYTDMTAIQPKLMWVIQGGQGDYSLLGQTWSRPQVGTMTVYDSGTKSASYNTKDVTALFFGGGNDTTDETTVVPTSSPGTGNGIFIANALDGSRMFWASSPSETDGSGVAPDLQLTDMVYPIPSDLTLMDTNSDGSIDRLYFGDLGGQLWRIDLGTDYDPGASTPSARLGSNGLTNGYVLADLVCKRDTSNVRDCSAATDQDYRRIFYRPDVGAVRDKTYVTSGYVDYDLVTVGTGDRADPLDKLTSSKTEVPVHNRLYAIRDYNFAYGPPATTPIAYYDNGSTTVGGTGGNDFYDATADLIETGSTTSIINQAKTDLTNAKAWYVNFMEATAPTWTTTDAIGSRVYIGEKVLARTVILAGIIYVTTFTPANSDTASNTCSPNEGLAKLYALNALDGKTVIDLNGDGTLDRSLTVGGGIPSELVTVIREDGTVGLVGASGGGTKVNVNYDGALKRTYWVEH